jgi:hypothetical protein
LYERHGLSVVRLSDGQHKEERTPNALYARRPDSMADPRVQRSSRRSTSRRRSRRRQWAGARSSDGSSSLPQRSRRSRAGVVTPSGVAGPPSATTRPDRWLKTVSCSRPRSARATRFGRAGSGLTGRTIAFVERLWRSGFRFGDEMQLHDHGVLASGERADALAGGAHLVPESGGTGSVPVDRRPSTPRARGLEDV